MLVSNFEAKTNKKEVLLPNEAKLLLSYFKVIYRLQQHLQLPSLASSRPSLFCTTFQPPSISIFLSPVGLPAPSLF